MSAALLMPKLGLTMTEGVLLEWRVVPGEAFSKGQILYAIESDKAVTEIEAETDGELLERVVSEGETVSVGAVVGRITGAAAARVIATPLARRIARLNDIDLTAIAGSGPRGRIKLADVERAITSNRADSSPVAVDNVARATMPDNGETAVRRVRPTPTQAEMARRLAVVKHGVPHFYLSTEAEVTALLELRAALNTDPALPKLTLTHFVVAAVGRALAAHRGINRVWVDGDILEYDATDVAMAVQAPKGLYVPVIRGAGDCDLDTVAVRARSLVENARLGRLSAVEMEGASIAVSNAGMHDVTWLTPIINTGQSSILGVGSVRELFRPDETGAPALRREIGLVFAGDHRVHTGVDGLTFLNTVKALLENPTRMLRPR